MSAPSKTDKQSLLTAGLERFQSGQLPEAERLFRQVLEVDPDDPDGLHLLGLCRQQAGRSDEAIEHIEKAITAAGANAIYLNNLGQIYAGRGDLAEAAESYRRAVAAKPDYAEALNNLGNALAKLGDADGAARHYRRALECRPEYAVAHYNLGNLHLDEGDPAAAIECFQRALDLESGYAEAVNNLGMALERKGETEPARARYEAALELRPGFSKALNNLGNAKRKLGDLDGAKADYERAIETDPDDASAYTNLGYLMATFGDVADALEWHRKAIAIDPGHVEAHNNLAQALLLSGRLEEGWAEYEWRFRVKGGEQPRDFPQVPWRGELLDGKTILVWGEQGVGDEILLAGMVPDLVDAGAAVVLECDKRIQPLFGRSFPAVRCVARQTPPADGLTSGEIDFQAAAGSLGRWLRPYLETFPGRPSYLAADKRRRDALREDYKAGGGNVLVGVAWVSKNPKSGLQKSMSLMDWKPLAEVEGVRFVDLQYGDTASDREAFETETGVPVLHDEAVDQMADLDAFAAQVAAMDLVVSVSNTTVHMAGALGVPTWAMLHTQPMSCWMLDREDSPWYPSVRLYRQTRRGEWADVVERVAGALKALVEGGQG